jgi:tyrosinase
VGIRKNQASLTQDEKERFVNAVKQLKADGVYDEYVRIHRKAMMERRIDPAHVGPAFLPWHREYLLRFEADLQEVDPSVTIPFWNWVHHRSHTSAPWTSDFMGGTGSEADDFKVTTGPFAHSTGQWNINVKDMEEDPDFLRRALAIPGALPRAKEVGRVLRTIPYDAKPWNFRSNVRRSFRQALEFVHNGVHLWVGGNMTAATSPNDPVFWLHHCNIDRLWARWQKMHPRQGYLPGKGAARGHNRNDPMWPWNREQRPPTPARVLNHRDLGYEYAGEENW